MGNSLSPSQKLFGAAAGNDIQTLIRIQSDFVQSEKSKTRNERLNDQDTRIAFTSFLNGVDDKTSSTARKFLETPPYDCTQKLTLKDHAMIDRDCSDTDFHSFIFLL
jgi:hypothetical protein